MTGPAPSTIVCSVAIATLMLADRSAAQQLAVYPPTSPPPTAAAQVVLRPSYEVRLESAWPAPDGETDACNNRASETVEGSLKRVGPDRYEGRFVRRTRLGFCGTHGPAIEACSAVLLGDGELTVVGQVTAGSEGRPVMALVWQPVPGTTRIRIEGTCAPTFTEALAGMYRSAVHSLEFPIPDGERNRMPLEEYGRTLELR
jgi:hypothetical protein